MEEKELHLRDYIRIINKRRYTLYTFFLITVIVVVIGTFSATPQYSAATKVLIEKNEADPLTKSYYYVSHDPEFLETQYQIIKSFRVAQKVVAMLGLEKDYATYFPTAKHSSLNIGGFFGEVKGFVAEILDNLFRGGGNAAEKTGSAESSQAELLAEMVSTGIIVIPIKESRVVTIGFMSPNPALATMIANTVAKAYMEELLEIKMSTSGYTIKWMTEKAGEEKARLEKSENALQEYMKAKNIITVEDRITVIPQKLSEFSTELTKAEAKRKELESMHEKIHRGGGTSTDADTIPAIVSNPTIQSLREQIIKAEQNVNEASKKYGQKHPLMIQATDELKGLKEKKGQEVRRVIASLGNEFEQARANEENLRRLLANTKDEALALNEKFIQYGILKREVETNRLLYEALITKMKEQNVTEQTKTVSIWVVEEAKTPVSPAKPKRTQNILLGILVGLCGGIGLCLFVEYLDNTIKSPDDAETKLGVSVLGMVETVKRKKGDAKVDTVLLGGPSTTLSESYKVIRTAVLLSAADIPPKGILVTSMSPQDGKTTTAVNLAIAIAQSENKVLLVDADMRRPRIHKIFSLAPGKGLSTYLAGASDMDIIYPSTVPNLSLIPSGPIPPNPSELLSSKKMVELIRELKNRFDFVVVDSPPLLSVTDSLILSRIVDGTIVVVKAGSSTYEMVGKGLKNLADVNSRILGMVINAMDMKRGEYYNYGYYNYYYSETDANKGS